METTLKLFGQGLLTANIYHCDMTTAYGWGRIKPVWGGGIFVDKIVQILFETRAGKVKNKSIKKFQMRRGKQPKKTFISVLAVIFKEPFL